MKTIEERAKAYVNSQVNIGTQDLCRTEGYLVGATEQKAIDDAEIERLKVAWSKEAKITHDDEKNYQQGFHDAIEKACAWICTHCECIHCEFDDEGNCPKLRVFRQDMDKEWKQ